MCLNRMALCCKAFSCKRKGRGCTCSRCRKLMAGRLVLLLYPISIHRAHLALGTFPVNLIIRLAMRQGTTSACEDREPEFGCLTAESPIVALFLRTLFALFFAIHRSASNKLQTRWIFLRVPTQHQSSSLVGGGLRRCPSTAEGASGRVSGRKGVGCRV